MSEQNKGFTFENIVFEGGGVKGIAFKGVIKALNKLDKLKYVKRAIGTSVGSMFAFLTAIKCTDEQLDDYFNRFYTEITDINDNILDEGKNLLDGMGLHDNENIYKVMDELLNEHYGIDKMTFAQLFNKTGVELTIVGTCLSTRKVEYFNHKNHPSMEVAKAVQISTSIPLFYTITKWNGMVWADGGIVENFPIGYYDNEDGSYNHETIGFFLQYDDGKDKVYKIDNIVDLLEGIENTELDNNIRQSIEKTRNRFIVDIDTGDISSINYDLSEEQMEFLEDNGYNSTIDYLDNAQFNEDPDNGKQDDKSNEKDEDKKSYGIFWDTVYWMKFW